MTEGETVRVLVKAGDTMNNQIVGYAILVLVIFIAAAGGALLGIAAFNHFDDDYGSSEAQAIMTCPHERYHMLC